MKKLWFSVSFLLLSISLTSCLEPSGVSAQVINPPSSIEGEQLSDSSDEVHSIPEYRGMTIHRTIESSQASTSIRAAKNISDKEDLSNLVDYPVEQDEEVKYYVEPNEWFYLNIYLSNPDSYEIQSFTLNGQKYANYMFEEGSTLDKIVLHLQAPAESGYFTFHIEAMKYLDHDEIKDVLMDNDTTIQVGIPYDEIPTCISKPSIYTDGAQFELEVKDEEHLTKNYPIYFYLSDGQEIIESKRLNIGRNTVDVPDLKTRETYQYGVITAYDSADGQNDHAEWLVKETFTTKPPIAFSYLTPSTDSVEFGFYSEVDYETTLKRISLYNGLNEVDLITPNSDEQNFSFSSLLSSTTYTIKVDYQYKIQDVIYDDNIAINFKTETSIPPEVSFELYERSQSSLTFKLNVLDEDDTFKLDEVVLKDETGDVAIVEERRDIYSFTELLSDHTYYIYAKYFYNLKDGKGDIIARTESVSATTLSYSAPTVVEDQVTLSEEGFIVSYILGGNIEAGGIDSLVLLKDGIELSRVEQSSAAFENLDPDTEYSIQVNYHYDLNDGLGIQRGMSIFTYRTFPKTRVLDFSIENDTIINSGDTIFFSIYLENQRDLEVTKVLINNVLLPVSPLSSSTKVLVQVVNDGTFKGGEVTFHLDGIYFMKDGEEVFLQTDMSSQTFFINGEMSLLEAMIVDENLNRRTYAYPDENLYVLLRFKNDSGFKLTTINNEDVEGLNITELDSATYLLKLEMIPGTSSSFTINEIGYANRYASGSLQLSTTLSYVTLADRTVVEIDDVDDLKDLDDYHYYKLTADIDLTGGDFEGSELKGYFDGAGHSIKNMKIIDNIHKGAAVGLFTAATGAIASLDLKNFFYSIGLIESVSDSSSVGFLAGEADDLTITDCTIDDRSMMLFSGGSGQANSIGSFIGSAQGVVAISDSINAANLQGTASVGGFIGKTTQSDGNPYYVDMRRVENRGSIYGTQLIGGLIGNAGHCGDIYIEDALNSGEVMASLKAYSATDAAFVGYVYYGTSVYLKHAANVGNTNHLLGKSEQIVTIEDSLNLLDGSSLSASDTLDNNQNIVTITDSFALNSPDVEHSLTSEELSDELLYQTLSFDASLWSFKFTDTDKQDLSIELKISAASRLN